MPVGRLAWKKKVVLEVGIRSRTKRQKEVVVHTLWQPENKVIFYGFRNLPDGWKCVANSEELVSASKEKDILRRRKNVKPH